LRLLPNIRYGTERYPEKVARRLRAVNIAAWIGAAVSLGYAVVVRALYPGLWKIAAVDVLAACAYAAIPVLHRYGALAAPVAFMIVIYVDLFALVSMIGTAAGIHLYYIAFAALTILYFGIEHFILAVISGAIALILIIVSQVVVPHDTGAFSEAMLIGCFIANTVFAGGAMLLIVFYALREAARAEDAAEREHTRSESLLANILPRTVADRLKARTGAVIADKYDEASILFADMAGFTARASDTSPEDLVEFLNRVFTAFDRLVERHGLEKIKTTGDAYMVVSGVPVPRSDHAEALAQLALAMRDVAMGLKDPHGRRVPIRIGIGSGAVVAGVVGTRKFFYDVWGDAVNVASRMETTGIVGKIQVAQETYERLKDDFVLKDCGEIDVRGKGRMRTWFLVERRIRVSRARMC
jgi:adenylate cyclase